MTANGVALATRSLTKRFGNVEAVAGLDLEVKQGEVFGFLGPNGAGKTTTIRMMAGLLRPTSGTVEVFGKKVSPDDASARKLLGLTPQENVLYPELTSRENLEYAGALFGVPRKERRRRADDLLAKLGLTEKAKALARDLSGGMKRRLTLATCLVHDPPVLVLDEPEAGLDPQTRVAVREFIRSIAREKTVVLTSHNMDEVDRLADRVAIIDNGKLVTVGTPAELKARVGEGDRLEITVGSGHATRVAEALKAGGFADAVAGERAVTLKGLGLARQFPDIMASVQKTGGEVVDVRYRGSTLEDVFISLTGRALRE